MVDCGWIIENIWTAQAFAALILLLLSLLLDFRPKWKTWWDRRTSVVKFGLLAATSIALQLAVWFGVPPLFGCALPALSTVVRVLIDAFAILAVAVGMHSTVKSVKASKA